MELTLNLFVCLKPNWAVINGVVFMYWLPPDYLHWLEERLLNLEKEYEELRNRLEQLKPIHIENLNYKIQELVVRELSGTLNIGLSGELDEQLVKSMLEEGSNQEQGEAIQLHDLEGKKPSTSDDGKGQDG